MIGHKTRLDKFNKIEIILSTFSDHSGMKLEMSRKKWVEWVGSRKKARKFISMYKLNNIPLSQMSKKIEKKTTHTQ